jgi:AraC-like DNA-binding protein
MHYHRTLFRIWSGSPRESLAGSGSKVELNREFPHSFVHFQLTLEGEGVFEKEGVKRVVPPGKAFIGFAPENARFYPSPKKKQAWTFAWIKFPGELAEHVFKEVREVLGPVFNLDPKSPAGVEFLKLAEATARRSFRDGFTASEKAYSFIMTLGRQELMPAAKRETHFKDNVKYMIENFREPFTVREIAARAGMTREHFTRVFLEKRKLPPGILLRNLRLDHAQKLIDETRYPLPQIATESGFRNLRQFRYAYRERFGRLPPVRR